MLSCISFQFLFQFFFVLSKVILKSQKYLIAQQLFSVLFQHFKQINKSTVIKRRYQLINEPISTSTQYT